MDDVIQTKRCSKCGRILPLSDFYRDKQTKDGLSCWCKACIKAKKAQYYQENKEAIAQKNAQYYQENKEAIAQKAAEYRDPIINPLGWARKIVGMYRQMDRQRGFNDKETITAEWFLDNIAYRPCAHCGLTHFGYIGCNRLDNTKGHTEDNVEAACFKCNAKENIRDQLARGLHWTCKRKARHKTA